MATGLIRLPGAKYRQVDFDAALNRLEALARRGLVTEAITVYLVPQPGAPIALLSVLAANSNMGETREYLALAINTIDELLGNPSA